MKKKAFYVSQVKIGALFSYMLIIGNIAFGLIVAPLIMRSLGDSEYGVYKSIGSFVSSMMVLDLGIGGTLMRYISKFKAKKEDDKISDFVSMMAAVTIVLILLATLVLFVAYFFIDVMFADGFSANEILLGKKLFILQGILLLLHMTSNFVNGIITGHNNFLLGNGTKLGRLILRIILTILLVSHFKSAIVLTLIEIFLTLFIILIESTYVLRVYHIKIRFYCKRWDFSVFKESFKYTILLFIQSIVIQFNGNIDNIVIGAVIGSSAVTIYSFAIQMFNMYEQCATAISGVILPSVTKKIYSGATEKDINDMVVKYGRIQWAVLGAALGGFICLGQEFFYVWLGEGFSDCYYLALIVMIPVTFPLVTNTCLAILKAKNLLFFRTIALIYSVVLNIILTIIGTKLWGYYAAAVGTAISTIVGSVISLNIYYHVKLKINIVKVYICIMFKISICLAIPTIVCFALNTVLFGSWVTIIIKACAFVMIYAVFMLMFGLNKTEKKNLLKGRGNY